MDKTGAGAAFWGGFGSKFVDSGKKPQKLTRDDVSEFARFANATAALCIAKRGGIPAMPSLQEVLSWL